MDLNNTRERHRKRTQLLKADDEQLDADESSQQWESQSLSTCSHDNATNDFLRRPLTMSSCEEVLKDEHHTLRSVNSAPTPGQVSSTSEAKSRERRQRSDRTQTSPRSLLPPVTSQRLVADDWRKNLDDIHVESKPSLMRGKLDYAVNKSPCFDKEKYQYLQISSPTVEGSKESPCSFNELLETKFTLANGCSELENEANRSLMASLIHPPKHDWYKHDGPIYSYRSTYSSDLSDISMHGDGLNYTILPVSGANDSPAKSHKSSTKQSSYGSTKSTRDSPASDTNTVSNHESKHAKRRIFPKRHSHARHVFSSNSLHSVESLGDEFPQQHRVHTIEGLEVKLPLNCPQKTEMLQEKQSARGDRKCGNSEPSTAIKKCEATKYSNVKVKPEKNNDKTQRESRSMPCTTRNYNASPTMSDRVVTQYCHPKLKGTGSNNRFTLDSRSTSAVPVHKSLQSKPAETSLSTRKSFQSSSSNVSKVPSPKYASLAVKISPKVKQTQGDMIKDIDIDDLLNKVYLGKEHMEPNGSPLQSHSNYSLGNESSKETLTSGNASSCSFTRSPHWDVDKANHSSLVAAERDTDVNSISSSARSRRRARASLGSNNTSPLSVMISPTFLNALPMPQGSFVWEPSAEVKADSANREQDVLENSRIYTTASNLREDHDMIEVQPQQNVKKADSASGEHNVLENSCTNTTASNLRDHETIDVQPQKNVKKGDSASHEHDFVENSRIYTTASNLREDHETIDVQPQQNVKIADSASHEHDFLENSCTYTTASNFREVQEMIDVQPQQNVKKADSTSREHDFLENSCAYTTASNFREDQEMIEAQPQQNVDVDTDFDVGTLKDNIAMYAEPFKANPSSARLLKASQKDTPMWEWDTHHNRTIRYRSVSPSHRNLSTRQPDRRNVQSATHYRYRLQTQTSTNNLHSRISDSHSSIMLTHGSQSAEHPEKHNIAKHTKQNEKREGKKVTQNSSNSQIQVAEHVESTKQCATLREEHSRDMEVYQPCTPHRREHDTIDYIAQVSTLTSTALPTTSSSRGENKDRGEHYYPTHKLYDGSSRGLSDAPLDLSLNSRHTPVHYTALISTRRKSISLNDIGHINMFDLVADKQINYGIEKRARLALPAKNTSTALPLTSTSRGENKDQGPNKSKRGKKTLNVENQSQIHPLHVSIRREVLYSSPPSIVEVAIALRDGHVDMENLKLPNITLKEILDRKGSTGYSTKPYGDSECEVIEIIKPRTTYATQVNQGSEENDKESWNENLSTTESEIEEERCLCLKACWRAALFFFFNVRS